MCIRAMLLVNLFLGAWGAQTVGAAGPSLPSGRYRLHNHPLTEKRPDPYGLRLDGLDGLTNQDGKPRRVFTFDFDHTDGERAAVMFLDLNRGQDTIHIFGTAYGRWTPSVDEVLHTGQGLRLPRPNGWWRIDFIYRDGVRKLDFDPWGLTDTVAGPDCSVDHSRNTGAIHAKPVTDALPIPDTEPVPAPGDDRSATDFPFAAGTEFTLVDTRLTDEFTFRFGDDDGPSGHEGFPGISGWGELNHSAVGDPPHYEHVSVSEWLFWAEHVPAREIIRPTESINVAGTSILFGDAFGRPASVQWEQLLRSGVPFVRAAGGFFFSEPPDGGVPLGGNPNSESTDPRRRLLSPGFAHRTGVDSDPFTPVNASRPKPPVLFPPGGGGDDPDPRPRAPLDDTPPTTPKFPKDGKDPCLTSSCSPRPFVPPDDPPPPGPVPDDPRDPPRPRRPDVPRDPPNHPVPAPPAAVLGALGLAAVALVSRKATA